MTHLCRGKRFWFEHGFEAYTIHRVAFEENEVARVIDSCTVLGRIFAHILCPALHVGLGTKFGYLGFECVAQGTDATCKLLDACEAHPTAYYSQNHWTIGKCRRRNVPLRIICRKAEEPRINPPRYAVSAVHEDAVLVCVHEVFVEHERPDSLCQFPLAQSEDVFGRGSTVLRGISILKVIW